MYHRPSVRVRPLRLRVEHLEDRSVPAVMGLDALTTDAGSYALDHILVRFTPEALQAGAVGAWVPGTALGDNLPLVDGLYEVALGAGTSVASAVAAYDASPWVLYAQPDYTLGVSLIPNDPSFGTQYDLNNTGQSGGTPDADIDAPEAWNILTGNRSTVVAVIDSGVQYTHPDLAANIWVNADEIAGNSVDDDGNGYVDDIRGWDFYSNDNNPNDENGHGTHVAGTIGAVGNNGVGVAGINWNVQIMPLRFLGPSGSGSTSGAVSAVYYAVNNGADISNNSWGGGGFNQALFDAISFANSRGHIFVAAAGNAGTNNDTSPFYPANYNLPNVVSVASTDRFDNRSSFSNYGATTVDLGAPGSSIRSTYLNNGYATLSGTSMAAPHVSGALALLRDQNPTWTANQLLTRLYQTVDPLASLAGRTVTGGRLNLFNLLDQGEPSPGGAYVTSAVPSGSGSSLSSVRLTFNEAINPGTFAPDDVVTFTRPDGGTVAVTEVRPVAGSNNTQFDLIFATQTQLGTYQLRLGPNVLNGAGQPMDQDRDGTPGEATEDQYATTFTLSGAATYSSGPVNLPITNFHRTISTINVGANQQIADLNVLVNLQHTAVSDLNIYLVAPDGTQIRLVHRRGGAGDNFTNTLFDDEASVSIVSGSAPFTGSFRPEAALSTFDGKLATGTWQLWVDDVAFGDTGTLNNWSLTFEWAGTQTAFGTGGDDAAGSSGSVFGNGLGGGVQVSFNVSDERRTQRAESETTPEPSAAPQANARTESAGPGTSASEAEGQPIELTFRFPVWLGL